MATKTSDVRVLKPPPSGAEEILEAPVLEFVARLHREFEPRRRELLRRREERQAALDAGERPDFLEETREVREGDWQVPSPPPDLRRRHVEITGPTDRKMVINALNSGADVFMADFEDSLSPTWENVAAGQRNLRDAVRRRIEFTDEDSGKAYALEEETATLLVRPRGCHLEERHLEVDGDPVSASLFDFGLHLFHSGRELLERGSGPYFYLPKLEGHREAALWNEVFLLGQDLLDIPRGSIRATVLVETVLAAFEMDEILHALGEHAAGLNAGRWDYIFSFIRKFRDREEFLLPDRARVTMTVPFMRAYTDLLVRTCHRRGAHAIGGMAAFIPSRDPEVNERASEEVRRDKERESRDGFDGTWVAHPYLIPIAREAFEAVLGDADHQKERLREEVSVDASDLLDVRVPEGRITREGVVNDVSVALQYLESWLGGVGAVNIFDLMEDTATAEIARSQLWQWRRTGARLEDGSHVDADLYRRVRQEELERLLAEGHGRAGLEQAAELLDELVLEESFVPFLTGPGYERLV